MAYLEGGWDYEWDKDQRELYLEVFKDKPWEASDSEAQEAFNDIFFSGKHGLDFEYALDQFEIYLWEEYGIELSQNDDFWDDFRDWYDAQ